LREDVGVSAAEQKANSFKDTTVSRHETVDADHGRIETRTYAAIHEVEWLQKRHDWPGLQGVVMVESQRRDRWQDHEGDALLHHFVGLAGQRDRTDDPRSLGGGMPALAMDMVFRDDECRVRTENAAASFTTLKHMAQNLIKKSPGKDSQRLKRETAASIRSTSHRDVRVKGGVRPRGCEVQWRMRKTPLAVAASKV
jgi:hypothetical protein